MRKNPFPPDGDASKIPEFTDFIISMQPERVNEINKVLLPILERANTGNRSGIHDAIIIGEIGRGKTHLLKFLEKKLQGKKVKYISQSDIPNFQNVFPVYVKLDSSIISSSDYFIYFFLGHILGFIPKDFGLINSINDLEIKTTIEKHLDSVYQKEIGSHYNIPQPMTAQKAFSILYDIVEKTLELTDKKTLLFMLDEMEGIILTANKNANNMRLVMDFFRQFHDSINEETTTKANIHAFYAMTAPAYDQSNIFQGERSAWLSRLRSSIFEIPLLSIEEFSALVSTALENDKIENIAPYTIDALNYIYRSVMAQPRYSIQALYNSYEFYSKNKLENIDYVDIYNSTPWLNPKERIDNQKVNKFIATIGRTYGYLIITLIELIGKYTLTLEEVLEKTIEFRREDKTEENIINDIEKFANLGFLEYDETNNTVRVQRSFYNQVIKLLDKETEIGTQPIKPLSIIETFSKDIVDPIRNKRYKDDQRIMMLNHTTKKIMNQLYSEEGITRTEINDNYVVYHTKKSKNSKIMNILTSILVNTVVDELELFNIIKDNKISSCLFIYDYDNEIIENKERVKIENIEIESSLNWLKNIFKPNIFKNFENTKARQVINEVVENKKIAEISYFYNIQKGKREYSSGNIGSRRIDIRGLWYSVQGVYSLPYIDAEVAQALDAQYKDIFQDFFGIIRSELNNIDTYSKKKEDELFKIARDTNKWINTLLENENTRQLILNKSVIRTPLPSGINPRNMRALSDLGLFNALNATSWRVNSLPNAAKVNPWILLTYSKYIGKYDDSEYSKIGDNFIIVKKMIDSYEKILQNMNHITEEGKITTSNDKERYYSDINSIKTRIKNIKESEFKSSEKKLESYEQLILNIELTVSQYENQNIAELLLENHYAEQCEEIYSINSEITDLLKVLTNETSKKHNELLELHRVLSEEHQKAFQLFTEFNINNTKSKINKLIFDNPSLKQDILNIKFSFPMPDIGEQIDKIYGELLDLYNNNFHSQFLSKILTYEDLNYKKTREFKDIEIKLNTNITNFHNQVVNDYHSLISINEEYRIAQNREISDFSAKARSLLNTDKIESLKLAAQAHNLLLKGISVMEEKHSNVIKKDREELLNKLDNLNDFLLKSKRILIDQTNKRQFDTIENDVSDIRELINNHGKIRFKTKYKINGEYVSALKSYISELEKNKIDIKTKIMMFRNKIKELNKYLSTKNYSIILDFISSNQEINDESYEIMIEKIGDERKTKDAIINLIKLGLIKIRGE